jgi:hypothetical protein
VEPGRKTGRPGPIKTGFVPDWADACDACGPSPVQLRVAALSAFVARSLSLPSPRAPAKADGAPSLSSLPRRALHAVAGGGAAPAHQGSPLLPVRERADPVLQEALHVRPNCPHGRRRSRRGLRRRRPPGG